MEKRNEETYYSEIIAGVTVKTSKAANSGF